eukprot:2149707-Pleurochrysis_carterae.AAC.2
MHPHSHRCLAAHASCPRLCIIDKKCANARARARACTSFHFRGREKQSGVAPNFCVAQCQLKALALFQAHLHEVAHHLKCERI